MNAVQRILVVGGNGFIGSTVCKAALARGMQVTSISSSGIPYKTPKGHSPAWTSKVDWKAADALNPESYAHLLPGVTGVVHTLGTLLEDGSYKTALREGSLTGLLSAFASGGGGNPLEKSASGSYESLNRDAALRVCETFLSTPASPEMNPDIPRPFIYMSAEDVFRPVIPARYIETKREAEERIEEMMLTSPGYRGVYIRPSLVYHPHYRPLTSPAAVLLDLSSTIHSKLPQSFPSPASVLRSIGSTFMPRRDLSPASLRFASPLDSVANAMTIPPIHVEHVADAICAALGRPDVRGPVGVRRMRELIGWEHKGSSTPSHA